MGSDPHEAEDVRPCADLARRGFFYCAPLYLFALQGRNMTRIELERPDAEQLLAFLEQRLKIVQAMDTIPAAEIAAVLAREKDLLVLAIIALETALKQSPCH